MAVMRAKMSLSSVEKYSACEVLKFNAVAASSYPDDGYDEDNTYAKFSPSASLSITVANPALFGKFERGQKFYVDFTASD